MRQHPIGPQSQAGVSGHAQGYFNRFCHNLPVGEIVDQLGTVKAEIADLEIREKTLRAELLKRCVIEAEGAQYAAAVTQAVRGTLDTKSVRAEMGDAWFDRRCRQSLVTTVTVAARAVLAKLAAREGEIMTTETSATVTSSPPKP